MLLASIALGFAYAVLASKGYQYWPVVVSVASTFAGLGLALWCNSRDRQVRQVVEVTPRVVRVSGGEPGPLVAPIEFDTFWIRLSVSSDRYVEDRIMLKEGLKRISIGNCLSPEERRELASALRSSIRRVRPVAGSAMPG